MEQTDSQDLERALNDFRASLPEAATCCNEVISETIILGSSTIQVHASRVNTGTGYMWDVRSTGH